MSDCLEQQEEEVEVLQSIYEGDECFKQITPTCFQYKYEGEPHSILVEISWAETYPETIPNINLETFHNGYLPTEFKNEIRDRLCEEANNFLDCAMTYTLFDWMKENADSFIARIPELLVTKFKREEKENVAAVQPEKLAKEKKEQLTKAQKRRITDQTNFKGERERGWNWVDVVKHLSQTGGVGER